MMNPRKKQKTFLVVIAALLLSLIGCGTVTNSEELDGDLVVQYRGPDPETIGETRVFAVTNWMLESMPESEFMSSITSLLIPIFAIPTGIIDIVIFPFKWAYGVTLPPLEEKSTP